MFRLAQRVLPHAPSTSHLIAILALGVFAGACSSDHALTDPSPAAGSRSFNISFASRPVAASPAGQVGTTAAVGDVLAPGSSTSSSLIAASGADTLVVTKAELVLSKVELTQTSGTRCDDDGHDHDRGCTEVERHFVLVNLPTDTAVQTLIDASIPAGTYASLEARLRVPRLSDDSAASAFVAAHPEVNGANVRVEGTFNGTPFTYLGTVDTRFELHFSPPVTVSDSGVNVTIHVDVASWFQSGTGGILDPGTANAGGANALVVSNNILRSFRAVRDDERDGRDHGGDDHGGNSGPGNGGHGGDDGGGQGHH